MKRRDLLAAAVAAPMLLRGQTHEQGIALLRKMQAALGGVERLVAVRDVDWTTAVNPHFQFDVLHPDLPAAFSVFIHRG